MMTRRKTALPVLGLTLIAFLFAAGGCGSIFESNQAACRRMFASIVSCAGDPGDVPENIDALFSVFCEPVDETSECDGWPAFADCMTNLFCTVLPTNDPFLLDTQDLAGCEEVASRLTANGCFPTGF